MPHPRGYKAKQRSSKKPVGSQVTTTVDASTRKAAKTKRSFQQVQSSVGLLVTGELETAIARCKSRVEDIAATCRARNQKFRDEDFDLGEQKQACLWALEQPESISSYSPPAVLRVTDIFEKPVFFEDGPSSSDIAQGYLGDCWFLSGLAIVSTVPGLLEKICVACDEVVGVYGFIFFRDGSWVDVIIDDQLFVAWPSWEHLDSSQRALYHGDPDLYAKVGRRGSNILWFAKSRMENETWVPLIEKAYAKFCGCYAYIDGGFTIHAIEDLTGGVSHQLLISDIMDKDIFWAKICQNSDHGMLFGVEGLDAPQGMETETTQSLVQGHAYSILRAVEYNGKRFVVVRNPWGNKTEWTGRWSDGSKEWTEDWLPALKVLNHTFGQDGEFVMEYSDLLNQYNAMALARLFPYSWISSSIWIQLPGMNTGSLPTWGDVSFTIVVSEPTEAVIALQKVDEAPFKEISGYLYYNLEFALFKKGSTKLIATSQNCLKWLARSQSTEVELDAGEYVLHVRVSGLPYQEPDYIKAGQEKTGDDDEKWDAGILHKLKARRTAAYSKAMNYSDEIAEAMVPTTLEAVAGYDLTELEWKNFQTKRENVVKRQTLLETRKAQSAAATPSKADATVVQDKGSAATTNGDAPKGITAAADTVTKDAKGVESPSEASVVDAAKTPKDTTEPQPVTTGDPVAAAATGTEAPKPTEAPKELVHEGIQCGICQTSPIAGPRYHCEEDDVCPNLDICHTCFEEKKHNQAHKLEVICVPPEIVHKGKACSSCSQSPIIGTLYECQTPKCALQFSCGTCYPKVHHAPSHKILVVREAEEEEPGEPLATHEGIHCDWCEIDPIVGTRYKCMHAQCPNFDLCEKCAHLAIHPADHRLLPIETPAEAATISEGIQDGSPLVLGLRVYTKETSKVTLGAQLKHGSLLSQV